VPDPGPKAFGSTDVIWVCFLFNNLPQAPGLFLLAGGDLMETSRWSMYNGQKAMFFFVLFRHLLKFHYLSSARAPKMTQIYLTPRGIWLRWQASHNMNKKAVDILCLFIA
jgi:hypothetical protein